MTITQIGLAILAVNVMTLVVLWWRTSLLLQQGRRARKRDIHLMSEVDDIEASLAANTSAVGSAVALLTALKADLDEALENDDLDRLRAIAARLGENTTSLANAIVANTPQAGDGTGATTASAPATEASRPEDPPARSEGATEAAPSSNPNPGDGTEARGGEPE